MKPKLLITSLTSCSGCLSTLISLDIFPQFLERVNLVYCPFMVDAHNISNNEVALVEGCVINEDQISILKEVRKKSKKLFALGTCAAFGGINSLSDKIQARALSKYVEIDGIIPGCPPPIKILGNCILKLLDSKTYTLPEKNLCSNCELRGNLVKKFTKTITKILPDNFKDFDIENSKCFLENGILCLGPITRQGCDCKCINLGIPCEGCMGPVNNDYTSNVINFLSMINLTSDLKKYKGIFYRFSKPYVRGDKY